MYNRVAIEHIRLVGIERMNIGKVIDKIKIQTMILNIYPINSS